MDIAKRTWIFVYVGSTQLRLFYIPFAIIFMNELLGVGFQHFFYGQFGRLL